VAKELSPIAAEVQRVQRGVNPCQVEEVGPARVEGALKGPVTLAQEAPESSSMAEARAGARVAPKEPLLMEPKRFREEQVLETSRDAELAMELVAREALKKGVDRDVVLAAQDFHGADPADKEEPPVVGKGKSKVDGQTTWERIWRRGWRAKIVSPKGHGGAPIRWRRSLSRHTSWSKLGSARRRRRWCTARPWRALRMDAR
jgi:hypothetical protein